MARAATESTPSGSRWDRLSTGLKMWIILSLGLLPLGVIAVLASVDNAHASRAGAQRAAQALLAQHVQRFTLALSRNAITIRLGRDSLLTFSDDESICQRTLRRLDSFPNVAGRFAVYGRNPARPCVSPGFRVPPVPAARGQAGRALILPGGNQIDIFLCYLQEEVEL